MPKLTTEEQRTAARERRDRVLAEGKCISCGEPRNLYSHHCDVCYEDIQSRRRTRLGMRPWREGGKGRPPKKKGPHPESKVAHKAEVIRKVLGVPPSGAGREA